MGKSLLWFCLVTSLVMPAAAQQRPEVNVPAYLRLLKTAGRDTQRVDLLLRLSDHYFIGPDLRPIDLDSAMSYVQAAEELSNTLGWQRGLGNSYEQRSKILNVRGDATRGRYLAGKAIEIFSAKNYEFELGYAWFDMAGYYPFAGNGLNEKIRLVEQSLSAFQHAGDRKKEADVLKELGDLYQIQGNFARSLVELRQALKIYREIGYPYLVGVYDLLGYVSCALGDQKEGIRYGQLAVQIAELSGDSSSQMVCTIYNRLGITYYNLNEFGQARVYFEKALSIARRNKDDNAIHEIALNYANSLLQKNQAAEALAFLTDIVRKYPVRDIISRIRITAGFARIYGIVGWHEMSRRYAAQLLDISAKNDLNNEEKGLVYGAVIPLFLDARNYSDARKYLLANTLLAEKSGSLMNQSLNHLWWFRLDSAGGDYIAAISHYQQYKKLNDSLFSESKTRQIQQLEIAYNIEKKDKDLELKEQNIQLLTKQTQLQQSRLQEATLAKNLTLAGIALLFVIIVLLYINNRSRQRRHQLLQRQQAEIQKKNCALQDLVLEKEWLVKEIHHRVKNNFHMVIGLLGTQSGYLKTEEALSAIGDSQHRIHAMSLIHQKLYQSDNLSAIDMPGYIHELVDYLRDSFCIRQTIRFSLQIDRIELNLSHCIPLGLILNEAITNSIKYAFPGNAEGIISISFVRVSENNYMLRIADNGTGLPRGFDKETRNSMGMNLMQGLSEDIDGEFCIDTAGGTEIKIIFGYDLESATDIILPGTQKIYTV